MLRSCKDWICKTRMDLSFLFIFFIFLLFRAALQRMEIPRLGVELDLKLPAYAIATAMQDLSPV